MKKISAALAVLIALPLVAPAESWAIPAFARKYGFNCMMCHTAYPKLNDWGQRYRDNGYQLPGQEGKEKNVFDSHTPIALRTSTGYVGYNDCNSKFTTGGFELRGLDLLSAGVMHKNVSFLVIYTPRIDEPTADAYGTAESQPGALESASIIFSNVIQDALNLRVGRFEPAYHPFSSKRSFYLLAPYAPYAYQQPIRNRFNYDDNQIGVEATGHFDMGFKYGLGAVNGTGPNADNNKFKDVYVTLSQTIGAGDGQSAGQRIGVFGYYGKQPLSWDYGSTAPPGESAGTNNLPYYRIGAAGSLNWRMASLQVLYVRGVDDRGFVTTLDLTDDPAYDAISVELDVAALANNRLIFSVLYNGVDDNLWSDYESYSGLVRYYLGDWTAVNVALHLEYVHETLSLDTDTYALLVDFGF